VCEHRDGGKIPVAGPVIEPHVIVRGPGIGIGAHQVVVEIVGHAGGDPARNERPPLLAQLGVGDVARIGAQRVHHAILGAVEHQRRTPEPGLAESQELSS
jgi:hypothetical protein